MTESTGGAPGTESRCPWCSSVVPAVAERCPACGAALREVEASAEDAIPGVTHVDPVLGMRRQVQRPNRLVGWLADVDPEPTPTADLAIRPGPAAGAAALEGAGAASVAPPSDEVRREMRRLELEALRAELEERAADARVAAIDAGRVAPTTAAPGEGPTPDGNASPDGSATPHDAPEPPANTEATAGG